MEALKTGEPKSFTYGDLTVSIKSHATTNDRMEVALAPREAAVRFKLAAKLMVLGWKGLTRDNKEVPYTIEELENVPDLPGRSFAVELGAFIWKETDISGLGEDAVKNG